MLPDAPLTISLLLYCHPSYSTPIEGFVELYLATHNDAPIALSLYASNADLNQYSEAYTPPLYPLLFNN